MTRRQKRRMTTGVAGIGIAFALALAYSAYLSPTMVIALADLKLCF